jgi:hypothetical protein
MAKQFWQQQAVRVVLEQLPQRLPQSAHTVLVVQWVAPMAHWA